MIEQHAAQMARHDLRVAIVGAGFSGIGAAIRLRQRGIDNVTIFEKADDLGGTWRDNTYPGVGCDIPSHLYRYSFAPHADWSHEYAGGAEILAYLQRTVDEFGVRPLIRLGEAIMRIAWREGAWLVETTAGEQGLFDAVIFATGVLHVPVLPDIPGRNSFAGTSFHTSRWPSDLEFAGRRVGIVGTGSTSAQLVPAIVDDVAELRLFQRTPQWIIAVENRPLSEEKRALFRAEPARMDALYNHFNELFNQRFAASLVGENDEGLAEIVRLCRDNLESNVHDRDLRRRLTPDYAPGCKRLVISSRFYPAMQRHNAMLVDQPIAAVEPQGVRTRDGVLHALDVLVFATGFDPFAFFAPAEIVGPDGRSLNDRWRGSCRAHRTAMAPGFPNLFFIGGPNSPIGNFSFLRTAEVQIDYVVQLVELLADGTARHLEPTEEATDAFNASLVDGMQRTVWVTGGCSSWYFDRQGQVASWPWSYARFEDDLRAPRLQEFQIS